MSSGSEQVRAFTHPHGAGSARLGDHRIHLIPAVEVSEGRGFSAYSAFFAQGERADLPAPYEEVWVVVAGEITVDSGSEVLTVTAGGFLHVPQNSPGEVAATCDTVLVSVSIPGH